MSYLRKLSSAQVSTSSMADIAFLLLTFFLTTTVINNHKGIIMMLPTWSETPPVSDVNNRNLFKIHINSDDNYLIEDKVRHDLAGVREDIKKFILNNGRKSNLSENPLKAIVSLKADRGTSHKAFIAVLDEMKFKLLIMRFMLHVLELPQRSLGIWILINLTIEKFMIKRVKDYL